MPKIPAQCTSDLLKPENEAPADRLLDQLGSHPELSGVGVAVVHILELIDRAESAIPELTRAMMAEPFMAQKLLRAANVALVRCGTAPVTTLSKAIVVLGLEQVRTLALATLLLSKLKNKRQASTLEGEFATAIYASTLAREIARARSLCHPEEAAVCALFRSFGRLVIGLYRYECYERILALSMQERISENQAAVRLLGLTFDRVGVELLTCWGLPHRILQALSPCPEIIRFNTNAEVRLQTLAAFSMEVALALRESLLTARRQSIEGLLQRFGPALRLERENMKADLQLADAHVAQMSQALGLSACPTAGEVFEELSTLTFSPLNRPAASLILRAGLVSLNRMVSQNQSTDATLKRACDIMQRAFNFQRVSVYSALVPSQAFSLRAVAGKACNVNADTQCLQGIEKDSVVREVLLKNANLYLRSRSDDGLGQSWEHWFSLFPDAKSFFLVPIVSENDLLGVIYADYSRSNVQGWTSEELELVEAIKQVVCPALQAERT